MAGIGAGEKPTLTILAALTNRPKTTANLPANNVQRLWVQFIHLRMSHCTAAEGKQPVLSVDVNIDLVNITDCPCSP